MLLEVVALAMRLGGKYVEPDSSQNRPQTLSPRQLLTCLILKAYLKTTYRGVIELQELSGELRQQIRTQAPAALHDAAEVCSKAIGARSD